MTPLPLRHHFDVGWGCESFHCKYTSHILNMRYSAQTTHLLFAWYRLFGFQALNSQTNYIFFNDFLSVTSLLVSSRGQLTLAWTWPDKTLVVRELTSRQAPQPTTRAPGQGGAVISECSGQPGRPYCKKLSLLRAQAKDTGYYSCYYKDVKAIPGTTAVDVYVFVRGESLSSNSPTHKINQMRRGPERETALSI